MIQNKVPPHITIGAFHWAKDAFLSEINKELHKVVLPEFEKGENGYYMPQMWFPHTTLATKIGDIGVYQCSPFMELKRFSVC